MIKNVQLTDENIQAALGSTISVNDALIFRYNGINEWNKTKWAGYRMGCLTSIKYAMDFERVGNQYLASTGYKIAFLALFSVGDNQCKVWNSIVPNPQYIPDGTSGVGAVGLYGPDGKLEQINPETDWVADYMGGSVAGFAAYAGENFVVNGALGGPFIRKLLQRHLVMASHTRGGK